MIRVVGMNCPRCAGWVGRSYRDLDRSCINCGWVDYPPPAVASLPDMDGRRGARRPSYRASVALVERLRLKSARHNARRRLAMSG